MGSLSFLVDNFLFGGIWSTQAQLIIRATRSTFLFLDIIKRIWMFFK